MRGKGVAFITAVLAIAALGVSAFGALAGPHDALIAKHAAANGVPETLIRRVIRIESRGNARAAHAGNYGLMQIRLGTARGVGYSGDTEGLLDPDTNLTYAVKYLAGAYRAAGCDEDRAVAYYQRGYYGAALRECAESFGAVRVAQADAKTDGRGKREKAPAKPDTSVAKPADVIKPKVVHTETIVSKSATPLVRPVGKFEPTRVAPPPVQQAKATNSAPSMPASTPKTDRLNAAPTEPAAKFELASVPLPPVRPEFEPAPMTKRTTKTVRHAERRHERAGKKKDEMNPVLAAAGESTNAVVAVLKKLVTPDKKPRRRAVEAEADPASHVQPPQ
jgi:transglycosylase-like protein with SLT domain